MPESKQETKSKSPLIIAAAAILLAAAGGIAYFTQNKDDNSSVSAEIAANDNAVAETAMVEADEGKTESSVVAKVDTAAGNAKADAKSAEVPAPNVEGINVEPGNPVVAKVDGKEITRVDVYRFIQTMPANVQQMPAVQIYPLAMQEVINTRLVQTQAQESKVEETEEFKREMEMAKQQIARNLYLQKEVNNKISDKMVKKAYEDYKKSVPDVEERRARHILVETEAKAKAVVEKLKTGGKFEELAKELSIGPTAPKGGDLGYFLKEEMVPEFANAAYQMEKGSVLQTPVKTQFGWHIIQLVDVRQRAKPEFEQVEPALRANLSREALGGLLQDWRKGAKIEQFDINGKPLKDGADVIGIVPPKPEAQTKKDG